MSGSAVGAIKLWSLTEGVQLDMAEDAHPAGCSALAFLEPSVVSPPSLACPNIKAGTLCHTAET